MRSPLITVITAVRNGERYLGETIASIQAQTVQDWEYLIVDDASTDKTAELVREAAARDPRIKLVRRTESGGPYIAANDALHLSQGRYIMRTDGDDLQPPDRFASQLAFLETNPQYKACVTYWQAFDERGLTPGSIVTIPTPRAFKWYLLFRGASVHSSLCIEREVLERAGGYRALPLSQDYRLLCQLTQQGVLGVLPAVLSHVRIHENRSTNLRATLQKQLAQEVLRDHWQAMTGSSCSDADVAALWAVGYSLPFDLRAGLHMLARWDALWRNDSTLDRHERDELAGLTALRRRKFLRSNLRRDPVRTVLAACGAGFRALPALLATR